jgi:hypothetical protein
VTLGREGKGRPPPQAAGLAWPGVAGTTRVQRVTGILTSAIGHLVGADGPESGAVLGASLLHILNTEPAVLL